MAGCPWILFGFSGASAYVDEPSFGIKSPILKGRFSSNFLALFYDHSSNRKKEEEYNNLSHFHSP